MNHGQSHYPQIEKTWNSVEPSQEWPAYQIIPRAQRRLIQEVIKEPKTTSKELQASLASIKVCVHDSTIRKRLGKNSIHGRVPRQNPLLTKNNTKVRLTFAKTYLDYPKTFGQIFCGLMRQKLNFLEGVCPVTSGIKLGMQRYHFFRTNLIPKILSICRYRSNPIPAQFFFSF